MQGAPSRPRQRSVLLPFSFTSAHWTSLSWDFTAALNRTSSRMTLRCLRVFSSRRCEVSAHSFVTLSTGSLTWDGDMSAGFCSAVTEQWFWSREATLTTGTYSHMTQ